MGFTFPKGGFAGAGINHSRDNGYGATHPDFIESGTAHIIRIVGAFIQAQSFPGAAKSSPGIPVQKLQHSIVLIQAVIQNGAGFSNRSIDYILLGIFVKVFG
jgi:hypothetical protein